MAIVVRPPGEILLVRRAESPADPWSGDVALPGGRREEIDSSLIGTARRETLEETGLDLRRAAPLGELEPVAPVSKHLPALSVTPFAFEVGAGAAAHPASREIESVHWVSASALADPIARSLHEVRPGQRRRRPSLSPATVLKYPCYRVDGLVIWGLTYRILKGFIEGWRPTGR